MDKKRAQGKTVHVCMTAGANKFLRIYYGRVKEYLSELSDSGEQLYQNPNEEGELFLDSEP